jgi:hypothetical protein
MLGIVPYQGQAGTIQHAGYPSALVPQQQGMNIHTRPPTTLWETYRQIQALEKPNVETKLQAGVNVVRHNAESAALAALLGFISGEIGLDIRGKYPIDGIGALLLAFLSVHQAGTPDGFSSDLRALGQTCNSVYFFRTVERWRKAGKPEELEGMNIHTSKKPGETLKRNIPNDPILEAGKKAGL